MRPRAPRPLRAGLRTGALVAALAVASATSAAGPARAEPAAATADNRRIVGILDVRTDELPPEVAEQFQKGLDTQLRGDALHWLASRASVRTRLVNSTRWVDGCVAGACLAELRTQVGAELVVNAALTGAGTSYGYVVTLLRTDTGEVVGQESSRCDVCTANEVISSAVIAAYNLISNAPDPLPDAAAERAAAARAASAPLRTALDRATRRKRVTGLSLAITGAALAAAGAVLYYRDDTRPALLGAAGVGAGLAGGGLLLLAF